MNHTSGIRELFLETLEDKAEYPPFDGVEGLYIAMYDAHTASNSTYEQTVLPVTAQVEKHMQRHCSMISQIMSS